jgi:hypothetical protein
LNIYNCFSYIYYICIYIFLYCKDYKFLSIFYTLYIVIFFNKYYISPFSLTILYYVIYIYILHLYNIIRKFNFDIYIFLLLILSFYKHACWSQVKLSGESKFFIVYYEPEANYCATLFCVVRPATHKIASAVYVNSFFAAHGS